MPEKTVVETAEETIVKWQRAAKISARFTAEISRFFFS